MTALLILNKSFYLELTRVLDAFIAADHIGIIPGKDGYVIFNRYDCYNTQFQWLYKYDLFTLMCIAGILKFHLITLSIYLVITGWTQQLVQSITLKVVVILSNPIILLHQIMLNQINLTGKSVKPVKYVMVYRIARASFCTSVCQYTCNVSATAL